MLAWVKLSVPTFTFSLASTACTDAQHHIRPTGVSYFLFFFPPLFRLHVLVFETSQHTARSATPMASLILFRWGLETKSSNLYACSCTPDTGQPAIKLGFSLDWHRKVWSSFLSTYQMNFHAANSLLQSSCVHSMWTLMDLLKASNLVVISWSDPTAMMHQQRHGIMHNAWQYVTAVQALRHSIVGNASQHRRAWQHDV